MDSFSTTSLFSYRICFKLAKGYRTRAWPTIEGTIEDKYAEQGSYPYASFNYTYLIEDKKHVSTYTKPFWARKDASDFVDSVLLPCTVAIRYSPLDPSKSFVREQDQNQRPTPLYEK